MLGLKSLQASLAIVPAVATFLGHILLYVGAALAFAVGYVFNFFSWPITTLFTVLVILLSPIYFTAAYAFAPLFFIINIVPKLEVRELASNPDLYVGHC